MNTQRFLVTLCLTLLAPLLLCAATQDRTPAGGGDDCPNKKATTTTPPRVSCTPNTTTCDSDAYAVPCGRTCTYTPPATHCDADQAKKKCNETTEKAYTQDFSCDGRECKGGAKTYFGSGVTVYTTDDCDITEQNGDQTGG